MGLKDIAADVEKIPMMLLFVLAPVVVTAGVAVVAFVANATRLPIGPRAPWGSASPGSGCGR